MAVSLIELYDSSRGGGVKLIPEFRHSWRMNRLAIVHPTWERVRVYRRDGKRFRPQPATPLPPTTFGLWLRAHLVNSFLDVDFRYEDDGVFDLNEVKRKVMDYVAADDDILTQFLDGEEITTRLSAARTFDAVVTVLEAMRGAEEVAELGPDDESL